MRRWLRYFESLEDQHNELRKLLGNELVLLTIKQASSIRKPVSEWKRILALKLIYPLKSRFGVKNNLQ